MQLVYVVVLHDGIFVFVFVCLYPSKTSGAQSLGHNASKIPIHHDKYRNIFCRLSLHTYLSVLMSLSELLGHYVHKLPIHHDQCPSSLFSSLLLLQGQGLDFLSSFFGTSWAIQILKICKRKTSLFSRCFIPETRAF